MQLYIDGHRGFGRTTRMLRDAITLSNTGVKPVIVIGDKVSIITVKNRVRTLGGNPAHIRIIGMHAKEVRIHNMIIDVDGFRDEHTFFDHYAIEQIFGDIINLYHKYD